MARLTVSLLLAVVFGLGCARIARSQEVATEPTLAELKWLIDQQAAELRELRALVDRESVINQASCQMCWPEPAGCDGDEPLGMLPVMVEDGSEASCSADAGGRAYRLNYRCEYDNGYVLVRPFQSDRHPFELKVNGWIQFRHHAFTRNADSWTDNAGITRPVANRNAFDIERARLVFSGYAQDPRLTYFLQLDGDTDGGDLVDFFDYWWAWKFNDRFRIQFGKRKVPASQQWLLGARRTRMVDRPMANDFFRPDRTVGLFLISQLGETGHLECMVGNGYRTANLSNSNIDNRFTYAATNYFEPLGEFDDQLVDYDCVRDPLVRFGHSFVYSPQVPSTNSLAFEESDFIRLSDGTRLTETGALAPGIHVSGFDLYFYGIEAAWKWQGWSANAEAYLRWIEDIRGNGPLPVRDLFQRGFYVEGGHFLIPRRLDANARYSLISGRFADASEYAAGFNWYPCGSYVMKFSFDVTYLDGSPLQNTGSDILVGDNGVLFRSQFQTEF